VAEPFEEQADRWQFRLDGVVEIPRIARDM
jgi:hypothetical protein